MVRLGIGQKRVSAKEGVVHLIKKKWKTRLLFSFSKKTKILWVRMFHVSPKRTLNLAPWEDHRVLCGFSNDSRGASWCFIYFSVQMENRESFSEGSTEFFLSILRILKTCISFSFSRNCTRLRKPRLQGWGPRYTESGRGKEAACVRFLTVWGWDANFQVISSATCTGAAE